MKYVGLYKPVDAVQFTVDLIESGDFPDWLFVGSSPGKDRRDFWKDSHSGKYFIGHSNGWNGWVRVYLRDWIIRDVDGCLYACDPDLFEAIFEPMPEPMRKAK